MAELVNMSDQFQGLPMDSLIGGPLTAACAGWAKFWPARWKAVRPAAVYVIRVVPCLVGV